MNPCGQTYLSRMLRLTFIYLQYQYQASCSDFKEVKFNTKYHRIVTGLLSGILTNQRTIFDYIVVRYVTIDKL